MPGLGRLSSIAAGMGILTATVIVCAVKLLVGA
jgi:hypothetical protein